MSRHKQNDIPFRTVPLFDTKCYVVIPSVRSQRAHLTERRFRAGKRRVAAQGKSYFVDGSSEEGRVRFVGVWELWQENVDDASLSHLLFHVHVERRREDFVERLQKIMSFKLKTERFVFEWTLSKAFRAASMLVSSERQHRYEWQASAWRCNPSNAAPSRRCPC